MELLGPLQNPGCLPIRANKKSLLECISLNSTSMTLLWPSLANRDLEEEEHDLGLLMEERNLKKRKTLMQWISIKEPEHPHRMNPAFQRNELLMIHSIHGSPHRLFPRSRSQIASNLPTSLSSITWPISNSQNGLSSAPSLCLNFPMENGTTFCQENPLTLMQSSQVAYPPLLITEQLKPSDSLNFFSEQPNRPKLSKPMETGLWPGESLHVLSRLPSLTESGNWMATKTMSQDILLLSIPSTGKSLNLINPYGSYSVPSGILSSLTSTSSDTLKHVTSSLEALDQNRLQT